MIVIVWTDGTRTSGATAEEIEEKVRALQWDEYATREEFRAEMARRARVWSGVQIDEDGSSLDFLWELERADMLRLAVIPDPIQLASRMQA